jgi:hypothetical protein|nr:MAG TPA: DNA REPAIR PROTEIN RAD52 HOMOLOG-BINDING PROTEIN, DNA REPAIR, DNA.7A [Caudoviricetes sp.]
MATSKDLIKIVDSGDNSPLLFEKMGELKEILNQNPNKAWVKNHPFAQGVLYLPIDKVETMLDMIFQQWRVEILSISQLAQSICCTVRLHYLNPITKEWSYHDGVGAVPLKTDKGFSAADLSHIKSDAVTTGAPAAKSFAIKDAAEHLGKLFGRDLNRKDTVAYKSLYGNASDEDWVAELESVKSLDELRKIWNKIPKEIQADEEVIATKNTMKTKLK